MLENGADIRVIQKLLGHASIMTTEIYMSVAIRQVKSVHANTHPPGVTTSLVASLQNETPRVLKRARPDNDRHTATNRELRLRRS